MTVTEKHIIDFDHHSAELRDHNPELLARLIGTGCPMGWSEAHGGFWAIWGYAAETGSGDTAPVPDGPSPAATRSASSSTAVAGGSGASP